MGICCSFSCWICDCNSAPRLNRTSSQTFRITSSRLLTFKPQDKRMWPRLVLFRLGLHGWKPTCKLKGLSLHRKCYRVTLRLLGGSDHERPSKNCERENLHSCHRLEFDASVSSFQTASCGDYRCKSLVFPFLRERSHHLWWLWWIRKSRRPSSWLRIRCQLRPLLVSSQFLGHNLGRRRLL